jgi:hypothetical protein
MFYKKRRKNVQTSAFRKKKHPQHSMIWDKFDEFRIMSDEVEESQQFFYEWFLLPKTPLWIQLLNSFVRTKIQPSGRACCYADLSPCKLHHPRSWTHPCLLYLLGFVQMLCDPTFRKFDCLVASILPRVARHCAAIDVLRTRFQRRIWAECQNPKLMNRG